MDYYKLGIGLSILSAILAALYFLYSRLSHVKNELEGLNELLGAAHDCESTPSGGNLPRSQGADSRALSSAKPGLKGGISPVTNTNTNANASLSTSNLHGQIIDPRSQGKVEISYEPGEPSEGTEGNTESSSNNKESHVVLYGQGYAPLPDEVDNVSLNNIDNISEFPCDLSFSKNGELF